MDLLPKLNEAVRKLARLKRIATKQKDSVTECRRDFLSGARAVRFGPTREDVEEFFEHRPPLPHMSCGMYKYTV
jgi:hypothetical protein